MRTTLNNFELFVNRAYCTPVIVMLITIMTNLMAPIACSSNLLIVTSIEVAQKHMVVVLATLSKLGNDLGLGLYVT